MTLATDLAETFRRLVEFTMAISDRSAIPDPPMHLAPCWHAMARLDAAGKGPTTDDDPLFLAARWEWIAWVAEYVFGAQDTEAFTIQCRSHADVTMLEGAA